MGKYKYKNIEYYVDQNLKGRWNWRVTVAGKKYAGDASTRSNGKTAAQAIIDKKG